MAVAKVKDAAQNVIIPTTVALGVLALGAKAVGLLPNLNDQNGLTNRITAVEARQVEFERLSREDRNEMMRVIYEVQGAVRRIEGKLEAH